MTLYDSILKLIENNAVRLYEMLDQKPTAGYTKEDKLQRNIETAIAKEKPVLDAALELLKEKYSEKSLDAKADKILQPELNGMGYTGLADMPWSKRNQFKAKRDIVKEKIRFFSQVLSQEGSTDDFQQAIRLQFGDKENYRAAVDRLIAAERNYWKSRSSYGEARLKRISTLDAIERTLEDSVKAIFGN